MKIGIQIKLINNYVKEAIEAQGCTSVADFCKKHKLSPTTIGAYLNLRRTPGVRKNSRIKWIKKLEKAFKCPIDYLFPEGLGEQLGTGPKTKFYFTKDVEFIPLEQVPSKFLTYEDTNFPGQDNLESEVQDVLSILTEQEQKVVRGTWGINCPKKTLEKVGEELNVCRERVRQIGDKALKKLRHPMRVRQLEKYLKPSLRRSSEERARQEELIRQQESLEQARLMKENNHRSKKLAIIALRKREKEKRRKDDEEFWKWYEKAVKEKRRREVSGDAKV